MRLIEMGPKFLQKHRTLQNSPSLQTITNQFIPGPQVLTCCIEDLIALGGDIINYPSATLLNMPQGLLTACCNMLHIPCVERLHVVSGCFRNLKMSSCTRIHSWYIPCTARAGLNLEAFRSPFCHRSFGRTHGEH